MEQNLSREYLPFKVLPQLLMLLALNFNQAVLAQNQAQKRAELANLTTPEARKLKKILTNPETVFPNIATKLETPYKLFDPTNIEGQQEIIQFLQENPRIGFFDIILPISTITLRPNIPFSATISSGTVNLKLYAPAFLFNPEPSALRFDSKGNLRAEVINVTGVTGKSFVTLSPQLLRHLRGFAEATQLKGFAFSSILIGNFTVEKNLNLLYATTYLNQFSISHTIGEWTDPQNAEQKKPNSNASTTGASTYNLKGTTIPVVTTSLLDTGYTEAIDADALPGIATITRTIQGPNNTTLSFPMYIAGVASSGVCAAASGELTALAQGLRNLPTYNPTEKRFTLTSDVSQKPQPFAQTATSNNITVPVITQLKGWRHSVEDIRYSSSVCGGTNCDVTLTAPQKDLSITSTVPLRRIVTGDIWYSGASWEQISRALKLYDLKLQLQTDQQNKTLLETYERLQKEQFFKIASPSLPRATNGVYYQQSSYYLEPKPNDLNAVKKSNILTTQIAAVNTRILGQLNTTLSLHPNLDSLRGKGTSAAEQEIALNKPPVFTEKSFTNLQELFVQQQLYLDTVYNQKSRLEAVTKLFEEGVKKRPVLEKLITVTALKNVLYKRLPLDSAELKRRLLLPGVLTPQAQKSLNKVLGRVEQAGDQYIMQLATVGVFVELILGIEYTADESIAKTNLDGLSSSSTVPLALTKFTLSVNPQPNRNLKNN